jgi:hypothetical protein
MSVVTSEQLAAQPAQNMADTLRSVPGMNVIQMSARDINLTARQGDLDARHVAARHCRWPLVYLDFFGLVLWDLVPSPTSGEIKQIEVVRGARLGRLGCQRGQRRRQHHHEDAARERGLRGRARRGALQPRRRLARGGRQRLPVERQLLLRARHQRQMVVSAERRLLPVRPVLPPDRHHSRSTAIRSE